jgi:hypothetical protein
MRDVKMKALQTSRVAAFLVFEWPLLADDRGQELLEADAQALLPLWVPDRCRIFFERFSDALRACPPTIEILASKIVQRNEFTALLGIESERWGKQAETLPGGPEYAPSP